MTDREPVFFNGDYKILKPAEYEKALLDPLWYMPKTPVGNLLDRNPFWGNTETPEQRPEKFELLRLIHEARVKGKLALGTKNDFPQNFNDDDRWCKENWDPIRRIGINRFTGKENPKVKKDHPDTVIVHHTATRPDFPLPLFNTLAMLRLYVPEARKGFPLYQTDKHYALNSGHWGIENGEEHMFFHGYHFYVYNKTSAQILMPDQSEIYVETLQTDKTGFHSGIYNEENVIGSNIRSTGIALVGDFTNSAPSDEQIEAVAKIIKSLKPENIIGHKEVVNSKGKRIDTNCPGNQWEIWENKLRR